MLRSAFGAMFGEFWQFSLHHLENDEGWSIAMMDMVSETDTDTLLLCSLTQTSIQPTPPGVAARLSNMHSLVDEPKKHHTLPALRRDFERALCIDDILDTIKRLGNPICSGLASNRLILGGYLRWV